MTNKEVINFLNQVRKIILDDKSWLESTIQPINEAFDMAINALTAQPEEHTQERTEMHACDCVSRQDALDCKYQVKIINDIEYVMLSEVQMKMRKLPSAQPEPAIPLQWIEAQIEWLKSMDNAFSTLTAVQISAMVNKWKGEHDG